MTLGNVAYNAWRHSLQDESMPKWEDIRSQENRLDDSVCRRLGNSGTRGDTVSILAKEQEGLSSFSKEVK
jgi:hypothetical protein